MRPCHLIFGKSVVSSYFDVIDQCFGAFDDLKGDVDLGLPVSHLRTDFSLFVSLVAIVRQEIIRALFQQFLTDATVPPDMRAFDLEQGR